MNNTQSFYDIRFSFIMECELVQKAFTNRHFYNVHFD
jgi:hypothetical protein